MQRVPHRSSVSKAGYNRYRPSMTTTRAERNKCNSGKATTANSPAIRPKLAQALMTISSQEKPPRRFLAGADAIATADQVAATLQQQTNACRELSSSLAYDNL